MNDYLHKAVHDTEHQQREQTAAQWRRAQPFVQARRKAQRQRVIAWVQRLFGDNDTHAPEPVSRRIRITR